MEEIALGEDEEQAGKLWGKMGLEQACCTVAGDKAEAGNRLGASRDMA